MGSGRASGAVIGHRGSVQQSRRAQDLEVITDRGRTSTNTGCVWPREV